MYYEDLNKVYDALNHDRETQEIVGRLVSLTENIYTILLSLELDEEEKLLIIKRRLREDIEEYIDEYELDYYSIDW